MKNIKTIVIDDEAGARDVLCRLISQIHPSFEVIGQANSAESGKEMIQQLKPDLIFLDVQMPGATGFDLLRMLPNPLLFKVIFATAHDRYAIEALRFSALDFLLKPISPTELKNALDRFLERHGQGIVQTDELQMNTLIENLAKAHQPPVRIAIPDLKGFSIIFSDQIIFLEADGNYTTFHLRNGIKMSATRLLKEYEELLSTRGFCRIHQSHMVNLTSVKRFLKSNLPQVELENGVVLNIARSRKDEFLKNFPEFQA